jgi:DNA-binding MarR family transcriptional regulator/GNAT superfamily N-acetyltransferase
MAGEEVGGALRERAAAVRAFNRFWSNKIGVLREGLHETPYSLTEARVLFELARGGPLPAAELRRRLGLDAGYLSRILARFKAEGLASAAPSGSDARQKVVRLLAKGRAAFKTLDARSEAEALALLGGLDEGGQRRLVGAMDALRGLFEGGPPEGGALVLRPPGPGELGWVVARHGALYAREYGWDETFEALVARIVADYAAKRDPRRECAWVAELGGEPAGCVFCTRRDERTAQLRLLLVEPAARGRGVGARLVDECLRFARRAGYERIVLWTNDVLVGARRIYERAGFELVEQGPHRSFGHDLVEQTWARRLDGPGP